MYRSPKFERYLASCPTGLMFDVFREARYASHAEKPSSKTLFRCDKRVDVLNLNSSPLSCVWISTSVALEMDMISSSTS